MILISWWLKAAALSAEISFTATKFGEDIFQDTAQAIPGVLWFFVVFPNFVGILHATHRLDLW